MFKNVLKTTRPFVIGITGGTAAGKTTLAQKLVAQFGDQKALLLSHDSYYKDLSSLAQTEQEPINYDHPDAYDTPRLIKDLHDLLDGKSVGPISPKPIIIVEGILVLESLELRNLFNLKIFVDTEPDIRIIRRITRDITTDGLSYNEVVNKYFDQVRPMHLKYCEPSKQYADIIIHENMSVVHAFDLLVAQIQKMLSST